MKGGLQKMKHRLYPGLHRAPAKLADGTRKTYFYAWKGGPRLPDEYNSPEFAAAYRDAIASKAPRQTGTLQSVIDEYQRSPSGNGSGMAFRDLAKRTQSDYVKHIRRIEAKFGTLPLAALDDDRFYARLVKWRDALAEKSPRQADYTFSVFGRILSWGKHRRMLKTNPCERLGRLYRGSRAESVWTDADEAAFYRAAPAHLHLALTLALWTGQRQGDLLRLPWSAYDGSTIRLQQGKTGKRVVIPVGGPLRVALDATKRLSPIIFTNSKGVPWTSHGFSSSWRKACAKAGIIGLTFHDLRGTAVTRLATVEGTHAEIGAITGHSSADVSAILEKHYLANDPALAESAIRKLETRTISPKRAPKG